MSLISAKIQQMIKTRKKKQNQEKLKNCKIMKKLLENVFLKNVRA